MGRIGSRGLRPVVVASVVVVLAAALAACSGGEAAERGPVRDDSGAVVARGVADAGELRVTDCFNNRASSVELVEVVPCAQPHDYEMFFVFDLPGGAYPGEEQIKQAWMSRCLERFPTFVGRSFDDSSLDVSAIYPTEETWNGAGDRQVLCSVTAADGHALQGSARDSKV